MELTINISPSEKQISKIIGSENWTKLSQKTYNDNPHKCFYCGFPEKVENSKIISKNPKLNVHVMPFDESLNISENFETLDTIILCDACHAIQHFDFAVQKKWIKLVNSSFSQIDLVKVCRWGNRMVNAYIIGGHKVEKQIFPLKKSPESYLEEIKESKLNLNKKIKVIFTKDFDWIFSR